MNKTFALHLVLAFLLSCQCVMGGTCGEDFACCEGEPAQTTCAVHGDFESCVQRPGPMNYCAWVDDVWGCLVAYNACALSESELECQQIPGCNWVGKPFPVAAVVAPLAVVIVLFGVWWFRFRKQAEPRCLEQTKDDSSDVTAEHAESARYQHATDSPSSDQTASKGHCLSANTIIGGDIESPGTNSLENTSDMEQPTASSQDNSTKSDCADTEEEICFEKEDASKVEESTDDESLKEENFQQGSSSRSLLLEI